MRDMFSGEEAENTYENLFLSDNAMGACLYIYVYGTLWLHHSESMKKATTLHNSFASILVI